MTRQPALTCEGPVGGSSIACSSLLDGSLLICHESLHQGGSFLDLGLTQPIPAQALEIRVGAGSGACSRVQTLRE